MLYFYAEQQNKKPTLIAVSMGRATKNSFYKKSELQSQKMQLWALCEERVKRGNISRQGLWPTFGKFFFCLSIPPLHTSCLVSGPSSSQTK